MEKKKSGIINSLVGRQQFAKENFVEKKFQTERGIKKKIYGLD